MPRHLLNSAPRAHTVPKRRYYVTKTGRVIMGSEVGVVDIPPQVPQPTPHPPAPPFTRPVNATVLT